MKLKNILDMKKIKGIILAILLTLTVSCGEDFLVEEPKSFLSPENTFINAAGLQTALETALKGVFNQWNGDNEELLFNHNMSDASVVSATDKPNAYVDLRTYATPANTRDNDAGRTRSFYAENYKGVHWGWVNYASGNFSGWQNSFVNVTHGEFVGLQSGFVNYADTLTGVQLGAVNVSKQATGFQLAIVNYAESAQNLFQLGLVNFIADNSWFGNFPDELAQGFIIANWSFGGEE